MSRQNNDWKERLDIVYSTNPDYQFQTDTKPESELLQPNQQKLRIRIEKNGRGGKTATIVSGFTGPEESLKQLARILKSICATGGSAKDGEIIIQGDFRDRIIQKLRDLGYTQTK